MPKPQKRSRKRKLLISLVIVAIVILTALVLLRENLAGMVRALSRANYGLIATAIGLYMLSIMFWAARWRVSLSAVGYPRRLRDLYLVVFSGIFVTNITPFTYSGGDPLARGYLLKKTQDVPYSIGFATILAELMLDLLIFLSFLMTGLFMYVYATSSSAMMLVVGGWLAAVVALLAVYSHILRHKKGSERVKRLVARVVRTFRSRIKKATISTAIDDFYATAHAIVSRRKIAALVSTFSATLWIFGMVRLFIIFQAFNYTATLPMLMLAVTLPAIVGLLPLLPAGIGTVDVTIVGIFLLFGVPIEIAVSVTLIERTITLLFGTAIGAIVASYLGVKAWRRS